MKNLLVIITILFICSPRDSISQVSQEWAKRYNSSGTNNDYAYAMTYDAAGNVYVTGNGGGNYLTVKYSAEGTMLWLSSYNGPANDADIPGSICVDAAGNVYVTGKSFGNGTENDFATIKYDQNGNELWVQRFNGANNDADHGVSVVVDASGNVYAGGWASGSNGSADFAIVKYSSTGSQVWVRYYNSTGNGNDFMAAMILDNGYLYAAGKSDNDYAVIKCSTAGAVSWSARYEGSLSDEPSEVAVDISGNVYVSGTSFSSATGVDFATVKYNNAGIQQWVKKYNRAGAGDDFVSGMVLDNSGKVFVTGFSQNSGAGDFDFVTISYGTNGDQLWVKTYSGGVIGADDMSTSIDIDSEGYIYVTGNSVSSGTDADFATIKYSPSGNREWVILYESSLSGVDMPKTVKVDQNGNVYVSGYATGGISGNDYVTVKYSQPIGITPIGTEVPADFLLGQNYPNPFNPTTNIKLRIAHSGFVSLKVYDITGKEAAVLVNEDLGAGTYNIDFDASELSSGTYFYRLETNGFTDVKKMVLVK